MVAAMKNGSTKFAINRASSQRKSRLQTNVTGSKRRHARDHIFTFGIEEEFQIVDPKTRELRSHIQQTLADGKMILKLRERLLKGGIHHEAEKQSFAA